MTSRNRHACLAVACASWLLACGEPAPPRAPAAVEITDSSGVRIVDLGADLAGFATQTRELDLLFRIGHDGSNLELFGVSSVRLRPDGGLAIANAGIPEILVIGPEGALVRRLGREGEGPGEFGTITSLHLGDDASIVAFDDRQGRLTQFDAGGEVVATRRMAEPSSVADLIPLVASQYGPALAVYGDNRIFGREGVRRDSTPLFRFTPGSTRPDTLAMWGTKTWSFGTIGQGRTRSPLPFGPDLLRAGRGDRAALADTHTPRVHVYGSSGDVLMLLRWDEPSRPVTDEEYEAWQEDRRDELSDDLPVAFRERLLAVPRYETHAVIHGVLVDAEGGVWVAPAALRDGQDQTWLVFGPDGEPMGTVTAPASAVLLDAAGGRLALLERDELGVESVGVYRIGGAG